jgi:hypothetical protein
MKSQLVTDEFFTRIDAVAADIWAHAVRFAVVVEFEAVGAPEKTTTEITRRPGIILLIVESNSTVLNPHKPILAKRSTSPLEAHSPHHDIGGQPQILSRRPAV